MYTKHVRKCMKDAWIVHKFAYYIRYTEKKDICCLFDLLY